MEQKEVLIIIVVLVGLLFLVNNSGMFSGRAVADNAKLYVTQPQGTQDTSQDTLIESDATLAATNTLFSPGQAGNSNSPTDEGTYGLSPDHLAERTQSMETNKPLTKDVTLTGIFPQGSNVACNTMPREMQIFIGDAC